MLELTMKGTLPAGNPMNFTETFSKVSERLYLSVLGTISSGGRPSMWPMKRDGRPATLFVSGRLLSNIRKESTDTSARVFISKTDVPYAFVQHFGGPVGNGAVLPPRPYMMFQDQDVADIANMFRQDLIKFYQTDRVKI